MLFREMKISIIDGIRDTGTCDPFVCDGSFGIIAPSTVSSLAWTTLDDSEFWTIDNFSWGTAKVPEPTILALMGLGLAGIGYRRHRSKQAVK